MTSATELVNVALTLLGDSPIQDIDEDSVAASKAKQIFDHVVESVESLGPWRCCVKRASLVRLAEVPAFGFDYYYQLPTDLYHLFEVNECKPGDVNYEVDQDKVATDEATFDIKYGVLVTEVEKMDSYLKQAVVEYLMAYLSYSVTANQQLLVQSLRDARQHAMELMRYSSLTGSGKDTNLNDYLDIRW